MAFSPERVQRALDEFGQAVLNEARANLQSKGSFMNGGNMNASYNLSRTMNFQSRAMKNSLSAYFDLGEYGLYQDQGVNGTETDQGSPYSYRANGPSPQMVSNIARWMDSRGIGFSERTEKQKAWKIADNIIKRGLRRTLFFSEAYEQAFAELPEDIVEAFALDLDDFFNFIIKE
jgi:hypothetical protein